MFMNVHMASLATLHAPIYRNFYLYIREKKNSNTNAQIEISINWCMESDGHIHERS